LHIIGIFSAIETDSTEKEAIKNLFPPGECGLEVEFSMFNGLFMWHDEEF